MPDDAFARLPREKKRVPAEEFAQICAEMDAAEQSGELDGIFKGEPRAPDQPTGREPFLHSFSCDMKLYKSTFKKILGFELTTPGFAEEAITRLEEQGCSRAREYYETVKAEWQREHDAQMKSVAHWYKGQCENEFERRKVKLRTEKEAEQQQELLDLLETKRQILKELLQIQSGKSTG